MKTKKFILILLALLCVAQHMLLSAQGGTVSYRNYQSPVKSQARRGTCTAFAIVAAMETFDGVPGDLSEQYIYREAKMNHYREMGTAYDEGAPLSFYLDVLKVSGTVTEEIAPYVPDAPIWDKGDDAFERMKADIKTNSVMEMFMIPECAYKLHNDLIYLSQGDEARNVNWIKARLDEGVKAIPVGYGVDADYWSLHTGSSAAKIHPGDFAMVQMGDKVLTYDEARAKDPDLNRKILAGEVPSGYTDTTFIAREGHAVTIVGYDDSGFLIKNSWSEKWGDAGYGWVSFDYHELYCTEALIIRSIQVVGINNAAALPVQTDKYYLKAVPHFYENKALKMSNSEASLSITWHGSKGPQGMKEVEYTITDDSESGGSKGKVLGTWYGLVTGAVLDGNHFGFPAYALDKYFNRTGAPRFVAKVKFTLQNGNTFTNYYHFNGGSFQEVKPDVR